MKDWNSRNSARTEYGNKRPGVRGPAGVLVCLALLLCLTLSGCTAIDGVEYLSDSTKEAADFISGLFGAYEEEGEQELQELSPLEEEEDPWAKFEVGSGSVGGFSYYESDIETIEESEISENDGAEEAKEKPETSVSDPGANFTFNDESNYCFALLNSEEKKIYKEIFNCFLQMGENEELSTLDTEIVDKCFNYVMLDHPEIFYVDGYKISLTKRGDVPVRLGITGKYNVTVQERKIRQEAIENTVSAIIAGAPPADDEYGRVKYAYDYIIANTNYDPEAPDNQNIVSVFITGRSVCQGYSMAMKYLLDRMGIVCTIVYGKANDENHSWNMVNMDGVNCFVDATWGDATYREAENVEEAEKINYNYFGVNDHILLRTHKISTPAPIPECTSLDKYYYVVEGKYFTSVDMEQLSACFEKARAAGEKYVTIKCSDANVYAQMVAELFEKHRIFELYEKKAHADYIRDNTEYTLTFSM